MYRIWFIRGTFSDVISKESNAIIRSFGNRERRKLALCGFFVIKKDRSGVYCPSGEILRRKSVKNDGRVRYCTKKACSVCHSPCFEISEKKRWREVDFSPAIEAKGDNDKVSAAFESLGRHIASPSR